MMKINLLPRSINERKIVKNTAILFGVLVVVVVAIGVLYTQMFLVPQVQNMQAEAQRVEAIEIEVVGIEKQRDEWKAKIPPIKQKLDFINGVLDYNLKYPRLYEEVAKWTYEKVSYLGMACDGSQVVIAARTKTLDDLGRYLLNMYRATDLFTEVTISGVPGYPLGGNSSGGGMQAQMMPPGMPMPGGEGGPEANLSGIGAIASGVSNGPAARYIMFGVNCKLKTPITAPAFGGATAGAAGAPGGAPPSPAGPMPMAPPPKG